MTSAFATSPGFKTLTLELLEVGTSGTLDMAAAVRHTGQWHERVVDLGRTLQLGLSAYLLADRTVDETITKDLWYSVPASWWQHAKAELFPTFSLWLGRPARYERKRLTAEVNFRNYVTFPECERVYPKDLGRKVVFQEARWTTPEEDDDDL